jgi:hypothetical protein
VSRSYIYEQSIRNNNVSHPRATPSHKAHYYYPIANFAKRGKKKKRKRQRDSSAISAFALFLPVIPPSLPPSLPPHPLSFLLTRDTLASHEWHYDGDGRLSISHGD